MVVVAKVEVPETDILPLGPTVNKFTPEEDARLNKLLVCPAVP